MTMGSGITPKPVADISLHMLAPKQSVIKDMIMIQLISAMIVGLLILVFKGADMNQTDASIFMMIIFGSGMLLSTIYSRISRI
tara:strand:+ start:487 stop:735 length:249 start_codon:yes stop_codon:yes gene_type:complete